MRILLTGSSGWLARFLAPELQRCGHDVVGLDVAPGPHTRVIAFGFAKSSDVECIFSDHRIEAVVHAGALHKPDIVRFPSQAFIDVNVTGTLNLLEAAIAANHDRFHLYFDHLFNGHPGDPRRGGSNRSRAGRGLRSACPTQRLRGDQARAEHLLPHAFSHSWLNCIICGPALLPRERRHSNWALR